MTMRELDGDVHLDKPTSALEIWYISIRDLEIGELTIEHLARCCRQNIFPEIIVPICL